MKKSTHQNNKSLKTVFIYLLIVMFIICIALLVKAFYIYQQSKFDPAHDFVLAIVQQNNIKEIIAFHPETQAISLLQIQDKNLLYTSLAKDYGIATNGFIKAQDIQISSNDIASLLWASILHTADWHSNLT